MQNPAALSERESLAPDVEWIWRSLRNHLIFTIGKDPIATGSVLRSLKRFPIVSGGEDPLRRYQTPKDCSSNSW